MSEEQQKPQRTNKYLKFVEDIQNSAFNFNQPNGISVELMYQQALSIHLRSSQLIKEGALHPNKLSQKAKNNQVDKCYKQQNRRQRTN